MSVKIRLQRHGKKGKPFYWIVAADARAKRDGRFLEKLGTYNPNTNPATINLDVDGAVKWLQNGAQPTDTAKTILSYKGAMLKNHLVGGVRKGALTEEQAEEKFQAWLEEKAGKVASKEENVAKAKSEAKAKALEAEKAVNEARVAAAVEVEEEVVEEAAEEAAPEVVEETAEEVVAEEAAPVEEEDIPKISTVEKSSAHILEAFESKQIRTDLPSFRPGDTVVVSVKVKEGTRTRLQAFEGVVMGVKKGGINASFVVRKISSGIGVERTFQTHSPMIDSITVKRKGDVRQAKLFYLRERSGKSARIKERLE